MDKFYARNRAATKLEKLAVTSRELVKSRDQESIQHLANPMLNSLAVIATGTQSKNWRLCTEPDADGITDEVVFRLQGVVVKNNLIPKNLNRCPAHKASHLSQYVEIGGIGTETFDICMDKLLVIHQKFSQHLAGVPFCPLVTKESGDGTVFSACNKFFTFRTEAPNEQDNEFELGVDTFGSLGKLKGTDLLHAPENIVKYFRVAYDSTKDTREYTTAVPGVFEAGDIVEMQLAFVASMNNKSIKISHRLQALTLLDDTFSKEAFEARSAAIVRPVVNNPSLRRKVGHFFEEEQDGRSRKRRQPEQNGGAEE